MTTENKKVTTYIPPDMYREMAADMTEGHYSEAEYVRNLIRERLKQKRAEAVG